MIIVKGDCIAEIYPIRDVQTELFSYFRYVISRLGDERVALLDGVAKDIEGARKAVISALDGLTSNRQGAYE